ncbi:MULTISPECIES: phosphorylase [Rhodomicrobium]|uniref:phosphorylase n=1 Tax=Rhodomicrobium TaxID=1068 RepID=UPI000B4B1C39|nr:MULTISPECIES: phosphorylase [Rhodomicrobium]
MAKPERRPVIVVTGLAFEARIAAGEGVVVVHGRDERQMIADLERAVAAGASGIVSFGTAGGLAPHLAPGDWVTAEAVITETERWPTDPAWSAELLHRLSDATHAAMVSVDTPVGGAPAKLALHARTAAAAVDMESHIAARVAIAHGLPFAVCRVVIDPAHRTLPHAALVSMRPDGGVNLPALLGSLARRPSQLPVLLRLAMDARAARSALLRGRRLLGTGFAFPDFPEL